MCGVLHSEKLLLVEIESFVVSLEPGFGREHSLRDMGSSASEMKAL